MRNEASIKVRQPLNTLYLSDNIKNKLNEELKQIVLSELNVKNIEII